MTLSDPNVVEIVGLEIGGDKTASRLNRWLLERIAHSQDLGLGILGSLSRLA